MNHFPSKFPRIWLYMHLLGNEGTNIKFFISSEAHVAKYLSAEAEARNDSVANGKLVWLNEPLSRI